MLFKKQRRQINPEVVMGTITHNAIRKSIAAPPSRGDCESRTPKFLQHSDRFYPNDFTIFFL